MSITEFVQLSNFEQVQQLNAFGSFIAERRIEAGRVYLYALSYFYVELLHELSRPLNRGLDIYHVFEDTAYLEVYLDEVDISGLVGSE